LSGAFVQQWTMISLGLYMVTYCWFWLHSFQDKGEDVKFEIDFKRRKEATVSDSMVSMVQ
jgi:hypothetical protein